MGRATWAIILAASLVLLGLPLATVSWLTGPPSPANPVFVWWTAAAVVLAALTTWLILRFKPPATRAWGFPLAFSVLIASCITATSPVAWFLLFFDPFITLAWLVSMGCTITGTVQLWKGRPRGAFITAAPTAALGVVALLTETGTTALAGNAGASYTHLAGWTTLDTCALLLLATALARRERARPSHSTRATEELDPTP